MSDTKRPTLADTQVGSSASDVHDPKPSKDREPSQEGGNKARRSTGLRLFRIARRIDRIQRIVSGDGKDGDDDSLNSRDMDSDSDDSSDSGSSHHSDHDHTSRRGTEVRENIEHQMTTQHGQIIHMISQPVAQSSNSRSPASKVSQTATTTEKTVERQITIQAEKKTAGSSGDDKVTSTSQGQLSIEAKVNSKTQYLVSQKQQGGDLVDNKTQSSANKKSLTPRPKVDPLAPTPSAPYGFKMITVKKPDGAIVKVKRPLTAEEAPKKDIVVQNPRPAEFKDQHCSIYAQVTSPDAKNREVLSEKTIEAEIEHAPPKLVCHSTESNQASGPKNNSEAIKDDLPKSTNSSPRGIEVTEQEITDDNDKEKAAQQGHGPKMQKTLQHAINIAQYICWAIMIIFPLVFLGLGIATAALNGHDVQNGGLLTSNDDALTQARNVAVSMWPIAFAAIIAQVFKAYAAYKLERGILLVTLEQLINSHSVGGALKQPFLLRTFNWTTLVLLAIWGVSPVTNQALVRMFWLDYKTSYWPSIQYLQPQNVPYYHWDFAANVTLAASSDYDETQFKQIDTMYSSLLLASDSAQKSSQDYWGNVKIPTYSSDQDQESSDGQYHDVPFASLLGIPIEMDMNTQQDVQLNMTTTYFVLDCTELQDVDLDNTVEQYQLQTTTNSLYFSADNNTQLMMDQTNSTTYMGPGASGNIHFGSTYVRDPDTGETGLLYATCAYSQRTVLSLVDCDTQTTNGLHFAQTFDDVSNTSPQPQPLGVWLPQLFVSVGGVSSDGGVNVTDTERFIRDPSFAIDQDFPWNYTTGLAGLNSSTLSQNLGLLVNTLWMAQTSHESYLGADLPTLFGSEGRMADLGVANGTGMFEEQFTYQISWVWWSVLVVSSFLLFVAACAAAYFERRTIGPDFLGFANTALRKGVKLPKHMSELSARERLGAMQEYEVLLQDVKPNDQRGKMALGIKEAGSVLLVKGRAYR